MDEFLIGDYIYYDPDENRLEFCENMDHLLNPHIIPVVYPLTKMDIEVIKQVINIVEGE